MMISRKHWIHLLCAVFLSASAADAVAGKKCNRVDPPQIPTGAELSTEEMETLKTTVEAYMADAEYYASCTRRAVNANRTIDDMKMIAANYNVLVIQYKEQNDMRLSGR